MEWTIYEISGMVYIRYLLEVRELPSSQCEGNASESLALGKLNNDYK